MIPALYLEKISSKKLPNFFERLLAVSDEGNFFITFDENIKDVLNVHQIQNEEIISSQISFEEELDLSHYYKYFDDQERNSYVKTVKINIKNNSTTIIYVPTENINRIAKVTLNTPLIPDELISNTNGKEAVI